MTAPPNTSIAVIGGGIGGGQRIALSAARALLESGSRVSLLSPSPGPLLNEARSLGCDTQVVGHVSLGDITSVFKVARSLRTSGAHLLYTHSVPVHETVLSAAAGLARVPTVIHRHNIAPFSNRPWIRSVQTTLWRRAMLRAREVLCVSEQVQSDLEHFTGRRGRLVWNGVGIPPRVEHRSSDSVNVGFVGRADPQKGLNKFLEAAEAVYQKAPEIGFTVYGSQLDEVPAQDRERAHRLHGSGVLRFTGPITDMDEAFGRMDILAMSSNLEGHPLVLLEAMARAKPVVAFDIPGCRETIRHQETGLLVRSGDVEGLADAVLVLASDPKLRTELGLAARADAEVRFAESRMLEEIMQVLTTAYRDGGRP